MDFLVIATRVTKSCYEIYPKFIVRKSRDLMIRGGDFYAIWVEERGLWSTDEFEAVQLIDRELDAYYEKNKSTLPPTTRVLHMWDSETGVIDKWHKYCQSQMRDNFVTLDERIIFSNVETTRQDYASRKLDYPLEPGPTPSWDRLVGTLYEPAERHKIEWAIGSIVSGDSRYIQKFLVFYGAVGTGKSTVLNIVQQLFEGYYTVFDAKALTGSNTQFALESFRNNPLVAIQHDGDLSRIEDNTKLNSLVSHEFMTVNEKYRSAYTNQFKCFLFMGTNKPVRITDSKSGVLRRLIDVRPSGEKVPLQEYNQLMKRIPFELGAIAAHCLSVYQEDPNCYADYIPLRMMDATNDMYNFMLENYYGFEQSDAISLRDAWEIYKNYVEEANVPYPYTKRVFKEELKSYFREYYEKRPDGRHERDYYKGFRKERFGPCDSETQNATEKNPRVGNWLNLVENQGDSPLDIFLADCPAQYTKEDETPANAWDYVNTTLKEIDTSRLHYVRPPKQMIVIDFDLRDEDGNKNLDLNIAAAGAFPPTYAEVSKGGAGLHLHYIYGGDVESLSELYSPGIEVKKFTGKASLRRRLSMRNDISIGTINSGLPLKGEKPMINLATIKSETALRQLVARNLSKDIHGDTRSSIDFVKHLLDEAYYGGMKYDISDMQNDIYNFASRSTNQANKCLEICLEMHFKSDDISDPIFETEDAPMCFFDIEIFPNLFILCYKLEGEGNSVVKLINPDRQLVRDFCTANMKRIGFNCRRYDNHLIYAWAYRNYSNEDLYEMSMRIINSRMSKYFIGEAYNLSYTDIYDFASAGNKKSLKKLEIEMGIHHQEFGHPWDKPLDKSLWEEAANYCCNDVIATEAAFHYLHADWLARLILADIADMSPNSTTNQLSTKIIFGSDKTPQGGFNYRDLSRPVRPGDPILQNMGPRVYRIFDAEGLPTYETWHGEDIPEGYSVLPFFPGYKFEFGKSTYLGTDVGEGGYVYAEPGMYRYITLEDVASMHPSSVLAECLFGPKYTKRFGDIVALRLDVKRGLFDEARKMFDGKLAKWLDDPANANGLADAMKTVINSVYGLTSASFENPFRDPRNVDNIVAKRGALFMRTLQREVQKRGFTVAHIKTDSIKIPGATDELRQFVEDFGKEYGYTFEWEAVYDCMCLVNDAVYIARYDEGGIRNKGGKKAGQWTATGKQFAVPYVFKSLFTHEDITFDDLCETFAVKTSLYLDINERLVDVTAEEKELKKIDRTDPLAAERVRFLKDRIAVGHNYIFVGRTGQFCPVRPGVGGGWLYRLGTDKWGEPSYSNVSGTSGRRWLESENVRGELEDQIDLSYFDDLANDAVKTIENYGGFDWFVNHDLNDPYSDILPF